ncbi:hypothetical protein C7M84_004147 [Penaeus vannamei]|uniref:Uncharacterized protein n=1 Tax=Penaeus vannamei TaxID=6689 RepID=A0A3R7QT71_PENVA|nr:hypothetical protein C7M84_004147 [Penaeus vannamei]
MTTPQSTIGDTEISPYIGMTTPQSTIGDTDLSLYRYDNTAVDDGDTISPYIGMTTRSRRSRHWDLSYIVDDRRHWDLSLYRYDNTAVDDRRRWDLSLYRRRSETLDLSLYRYEHRSRRSETHLSLYRYDNTTVDDRRHYLSLYRYDNTTVDDRRHISPLIGIRRSETLRSSPYLVMTHRSRRSETLKSPYTVDTPHRRFGDTGIFPLYRYDTTTSRRSETLRIFLIIGKNNRSATMETLGFASLMIGMTKQSRSRPGIFSLYVDDRRTLSISPYNSVCDNTRQSRSETLSLLYRYDNTTVDDLETWDLSLLSRYGQHHRSRSGHYLSLYRYDNTTVDDRDTEISPYTSTIGDTGISPYIGMTTPQSTIGDADDLSLYRYDKPGSRRSETQKSLPYNRYATTAAVDDTRDTEISPYIVRRSEHWVSLLISGYDNTTVDDRRHWDLSLYRYDNTAVEIGAVRQTIDGDTGISPYNRYDNTTVRRSDTLSLPISVMTTPPVFDDSIGELSLPISVMTTPQFATT